MSMQRRGFFAALLGGSAGVALASESVANKYAITGTVGPSYPLPLPEIHWGGDKAEDITTVRTIIAAAASRLAFMTEEERHYWLEFAQGYGQWPAEILQVRLENERPCLTINKIDRLCALAIERSRQVGEWPLVHEFENLQIALALRNADAQRAYNYVYSAYVESKQRPITIRKADA